MKRWPLVLPLLTITAFRPAEDLRWHTDLEAAKAEAQSSGRPILSLRMLGKLTDELSCANSRFFRTTLYANPDVARVMRERFVLHWSSERAVPIMTIDFGDGRTLKSTITGNSAHYVLDGEGRVMDVIPGLYSPEAFLAQLAQATTLTTPAAHQRAADNLARELRRSGAKLEALPRGKADAPSAVRIAVSKAIVEAPMLRPVKVEEPDFGALARPVVLAEQSIARMREENRTLDDATFAAMVDRFEDSISRDTAQNEYDLHQRVHRYLAERDRPELAETNAWVYRELFATPAGDPWLGLHDETVYTGLDDGGVTR